MSTRYSAHEFSPFDERSTGGIESFNPASRRKPGLHIADQISPGGAREEAWAAGFVTSNGTHIPLFVPLAQGTPDFRVPRSERKNR